MKKPLLNDKKHLRRIAEIAMKHPLISPAMLRPSAGLKEANRSKEIETLARLVVNRVFSVYSKKYIRKCLRDEPDSLLGLCGRLRQSLKSKMDGFGQKIVTVRWDPAFTFGPRRRKRK
jgi:hypothetical protein